MSNNTTAANNKTKKTIRFYSKEELKALSVFIKEGAQPTKELLKDFCEKYNRPFLSIQNYIYAKRRNSKFKRAKVKNNSPKVALRTKSDNKNVAKISKGEFKIPVNNWNITNEQGQMYFVVKF